MQTCRSNCLGWWCRPAAQEQPWRGRALAGSLEQTSTQVYALHNPYLRGGRAAVLAAAAVPGPGPSSFRRLHRSLDAAQHRCSSDNKLWVQKMSKTNTFGWQHKRCSIRMQTSRRPGRRLASGRCHSSPFHSQTCILPRTRRRRRRPATQQVELLCSSSSNPFEGIFYFLHHIFLRCIFQSLRFVLLHHSSPMRGQPLERFLAMPLLITVRRFKVAAALLQHGCCQLVLQRQECCECVFVVFFLLLHFTRVTAKCGTWWTWPRVARVHTLYLVHSFDRVVCCVACSRQQTDTTTAHT